MMQTAEILVLVAKVYAGLGGLVAISFLAVGIERVDPSSRGVYAFRPLLLPGLTLLWPYVLFRWIGRAQSAKESED